MKRLLCLFVGVAALSGVAYAQYLKSPPFSIDTTLLNGDDPPQWMSPWLKLVFLAPQNHPFPIVYFFHKNQGPLTAQYQSQWIELLPREYDVVLNLIHAQKCFDISAARPLMRSGHDMLGIIMDTDTRDHWTCVVDQSSVLAFLKSVRTSPTIDWNHRETMGIDWLISECTDQIGRDAQFQVRRAARKP